MSNQGRVFLRHAQTLRIWHAIAKALFDLRRQPIDHWGVKHARRDRHHPDTRTGEFAGDRQGHRDHAALGRGIGRLPDLAVEGGDRGGVDNDATFVVLQWIDRAHVRRGQADRVEGADQVDADCALERVQLQRAVAADDAAGGADARAVDQDARGPVRRFGCRHRRFGRGGVGHVAADRDPADRGGVCLRGGVIDIEQGDLAAARRQQRRGCRAKAGAPAGDNCRMSVEIHRPVSCLDVIMPRRWRMTSALAPRGVCYRPRGRDETSPPRITAAACHDGGRSRRSPGYSLWRRRCSSGPGSGVSGRFTPGRDRSETPRVCAVPVPADHGRRPQQHGPDTADCRSLPLFQRPPCSSGPTVPAAMPVGANKCQMRREGAGQRPAKAVVR